MAWSSLLRRLVPVLAIVLAMGAVGTAMAQTDPGRPADPQPAPVRPVEPREICVPAGLALTVIQADGLLAEAMPQPAADEGGRRDPAVDPAVRRIVVNGPVVVGACADYQGYWAEASGGTGIGRLVLYQNSDASNVADRRAVARDVVERTLRGPARATARLKATTALREPGTYVFDASLTAVAKSPATSAAAASADEDSLWTRFVVEIRAPQPKGTIRGVVEDLEGNPIAGARVAAMRQPVREASLPLSGDRVSANLLPATGLVLAAGEGTVPFGPEPAPGPTAATGRDGRYALEVPPGRYVVQAVAPGYVVQWYDGAATPADASQVLVEPGLATDGVDFWLSRQPAPPPVLRGVIEGTVTDVDGKAIAGAVVAARQAPEAAPGRPLQDQPRDPGAGPVATTNERGAYRIVVPEGAYYVMAQARGFATEWFREAESHEGAEVVKVLAAAPVGNVDFTLAVAPAPEPPAPVKRGTIAGFVGDGESPIAGAVVTARMAPETGPRPLDEPRVPSPGPVARTDENGMYRIEVPEGAYLVMAQARGFAVQWYDGVLEPKDATPVKVVEGTPAEGIDFDLEKMPDVVPPAPGDRGVIRGTAATESGRPVPGARVFAVPVDLLPKDPSVVPGPIPFPTNVPAGATNAEGVFEILAPAGEYVVALLAPRSDRTADLVILYYDNVTVLADATPVEVLAGEVTNGIDFTVK